MCSDHEQEIRLLLEHYQKLKDEKDDRRRDHKYPKEIPVIENGLHTPELGNAIVKYIFQANGYKKAKLIGSLALGKTSTHDIDVLVPLRNKKTKSRCVSHLHELLQPKRMHTLYFDRALFETEKFGNIELFFSTKHFTYGVK